MHLHQAQIRLALINPDSSSVAQFIPSAKKKRIDFGFPGNAVSVRNDSEAERLLPTTTSERAGRRALRLGWIQFNVFNILHFVLGGSVNPHGRLAAITHSAQIPTGDWYTTVPVTPSNTL